MKKQLLSFLGATLLTGGALANSTYPNDNYETDLQQMQKYMNSLVSSHLTRSRMNNIGYPRIDIKNTQTYYIYQFDLAGIPKENIQLSIDENNILTLKGKKENKIEKKSDKYMQQEIFFGSFSRSMKLPEDIDQNKIETQYNNGILKLRIGKKKPKKTKSKLLKIQ